MGPGEMTAWLTNRLNSHINNKCSIMVSGQNMQIRQVTESTNANT